MAYIAGIKTDTWTLVQEFGLGTLGMTIDPQGTKVWKYVKLRNESATVAVAGTSSAAGVPLTGSILAYLAAPANDAEINTVVSDYTDAETIPVGCGAAFAAIVGTLATAYYGWLLTKGYYIDVTAIGGTSDNDQVMCSSTDLTLTTTTAVTDPVIGICIVDATKNIRLNCY